MSVTWYKLKSTILDQSFCNPIIILKIREAGNQARHRGCSLPLPSEAAPSACPVLFPAAPPPFPAALPPQWPPPVWLLRPRLSLPSGPGALFNPGGSGAWLPGSGPRLPWLPCPCCRGFSAKFQLLVPLFRDGGSRPRHGERHEDLRVTYLPCGACVFPWSQLPSDPRARPVFPRVQSVRLQVRRGRTAVPGRAPGTDWRGLQVSTAGRNRRRSRRSDR